MQGWCLICGAAACQARSACLRQGGARSGLARVEAPGEQQDGLLVPVAPDGAAAVDTVGIAGPARACPERACRDQQQGEVQRACHGGARGWRAPGRGLPASEGPAEVARTAVLAAHKLNGALNLAWVAINPRRIDSDPSGGSAASARATAARIPRHLSATVLPSCRLSAPVQQQRD